MHFNISDSANNTKPLITSSYMRFITITKYKGSLL